MKREVSICVYLGSLESLKMHTVRLRDYIRTVKRGFYGIDVATGERRIIEKNIVGWTEYGSAPAQD